MDFRRKRNRLASYDYSADGVYFLTACSIDRLPLFGEIVRDERSDEVQVVLTDTGSLIDGSIRSLASVFSGVSVLKYVIMPNHVHLLVQLYKAQVSTSSLMNYFKGHVTRLAQKHIWQKSFFDHVVRNEADMQRIWKYIDSNPAKWQEDRYYIHD